MSEGSTFNVHHESWSMFIPPAKRALPQWTQVQSMPLTSASFNRVPWRGAAEVACLWRGKKRWIDVLVQQQAKISTHT